MQKRLRDREKEIELDERDRKREKEELEEIRQRLLAEGHPDPDAELQRVNPPGTFPNLRQRHLIDSEIFSLFCRITAFCLFCNDVCAFNINMPVHQSTTIS